MIERITSDNPLTARHVGMMAVMRSCEVNGPIEHATGNEDWCIWIGERNWRRDGYFGRVDYDGYDIIAVLPMPDLSGLEEANADE